MSNKGFFSTQGKLLSDQLVKIAKFELVRNFMPVLVICRFDLVLIKKEVALPRRTFSSL